MKTEEQQYSYPLASGKSPKPPETPAVYYDNIPAELKQLHRWVLWRYEQRGDSWTKPPIVATGGAVRYASATDPGTWLSYVDAVQQREGLNNAAGYTFYGLGFMLGDGYAGIDIDRKPHAELSEDESKAQYKVYTTFQQAYIEYSPGGNHALHILAKVNFNEQGRDRGGIGVFGKNRYFTVTGQWHYDHSANGYAGSTNGPIPDTNPTHFHSLISQMPSSGDAFLDSVVLTQVDSEEQDEDVLLRARRQANADKFNALWHGQGWQQILLAEGKTDTSQSMADMSLMQMLCHLSQDNEQVLRLFKSSALWHDIRIKKKGNSYPLRTMKKARMYQQRDAEDNAHLVGNWDHLLKQATLPQGRAAELAWTEEDELASKADRRRIYETVLHTLPPNCPKFADTFAYTQGAAIEYTKTSCMAATFTLVQLAGARRVLSAQLKNPPTLYTILIGGTGYGKDVVPKTMDAVVEAAGLAVKRGPEWYESPQAVHERLKMSPAVISVMDEVGDPLQSVRGDKSSHGVKAMLGALRKLYTKAYGTYNPPMAKSASRSTKEFEERHQSILQPHLGYCMIGTPNQIFDNMDSAQIQSGTMNRNVFLIIDEDETVYENRVFDADPPDWLIAHMGGLNKLCPANTEGRALFMPMLPEDSNTKPTDIELLPIDEDALDLFYETKAKLKAWVRSFRGNQREFHSAASKRWCENAARMATGIAFYEGKRSIPADLMLWCLNFVFAAGRLVIAPAQDAVAAAEGTMLDQAFAKDVDRLEGYLRKQGKQGATGRDVAHYCLQRKQAPYRKRVVESLLEAGVVVAEEAHTGVRYYYVGEKGRDGHK